MNRYTKHQFKLILSCFNRNLTHCCQFSIAEKFFGVIMDNILYFKCDITAVGLVKSVAELTYQKLKKYVSLSLLVLEFCIYNF